MTFDYVKNGLEADSTAINDNLMVERAQGAIASDLEVIIIAMRSYSFKTQARVQETVYACIKNIVLRDTERERPGYYFTLNCILQRALKDLATHELPEASFKPDLKIIEYFSNLYDKSDDRSQGILIDL